VMFEAARQRRATGSAEKPVESFSRKERKGLGS